MSDIRQLIRNLEFLVVKLQNFDNENLRKEIDKLLIKIKKEIDNYEGK